VFGTGEIQTRERGAREIEERKGISLAWFSREIEAREDLWWDPYHFSVFATQRRNREETTNIFVLPFLPFNRSAYN
jgi:hypothetical protein